MAVHLRKGERPDGALRHRDAVAGLLRSRLLGQRGFTLIELLIVILLSSLISVAVLMVFRGTSSVFNSQEVRILNQDDARTAINQMARYLRMATSSADNGSTVSNAIANALPQEIEFYCDMNGDGHAERVRYYLEESLLRSQTEEPQWVTTPSPAWVYGVYETDGVVIENRVRNGTQPMFVYYRQGGSGALEAFNPSTDAQREAVVAIGITIRVGERPDLAERDVVLSTDVQIRQRYEGGLK